MSLSNECCGGRGSVLFYMGPVGWVKSAMAATLSSAAAMEAVSGHQLRARLNARLLLDPAIPLARPSSACEANEAAGL